MKMLINETEIVTKKDGSLSGLLFILSPVIAVYLAFKNYKTSWAKNIIWLFVAFYGYTLVISNDRMDAASYSDKLIYQYNNPTSFSVLLESFYSSSSKQLDVIDPIITFIVSSFTPSYHVLFAIYGLVFGFFYSRNIWYLLSRIEDKIKFQALIYCIIFALVIGFYNINGFRFWTAGQVFFFGAFPFIFERKTNYLWVAIASILFHFSFVVPLLFLLLYIVLRNRIHLFFAFFIITFFINTVNLDSIRIVMENILPEMLFDKTQGYINEEYATTVTDGKSQSKLIVRVFENLLKWIVTVFFIYIYSKDLKALRAHPKIFSLFSFSLLFLGFANLFSLIPSGGRFVVIGTLFAIASIYFYLQIIDIKNKSRLVFYLTLPFIVLYFLVSFRLAADTISLTTIMGNPIVMFFVERDLAIIEVLRP